MMMHLQKFTKRRRTRSTSLNKKKTIRKRMSVTIRVTLALAKRTLRESGRYTRIQRSQIKSRYQRRQSQRRRDLLRRGQRRNKRLWKLHQRTRFLSLLLLGFVPRARNIKTCYYQRKKLRSRSKPRRSSSPIRDFRPNQR